MDEARLRRVKEAIRDEVSSILRGFKDPRLGFVSVTDVDVSRDAKVAKVFVSVLGSDADKSDSLAALKRGAGYVRTELGKRIQLRYTPEILFRLDDSIERGSRIQTILGELYPDGAKGPAGGPGEDEG
ncbi:MAG: 30S ribosome-binding factor RbfA [Bacillota bacterium]|jgi:ribosome-binding factor A|nr:MAG: 30S ribosome-binding factor RbfA [Bacillota bacterium]